MSIVRMHYKLFVNNPIAVSAETMYYIKNQQDATLAVSFINHCKITLHVLDDFCVHHQEY